MLRTFSVAAVFALQILGTQSANAAVVPTPDRNAAGVERTFGVQRGIIAVIGLPSPADGLVRIAKSGKYTVYFQSGDAKEVAAVRKAADGNFVSMRRDGYRKVLSGVTSLEEVWRVTQDVASAPGGNGFWAVNGEHGKPNETRS